MVDLAVLAAALTADQDQAVTDRVAQVDHMVAGLMDQADRALADLTEDQDQAVTDQALAALTADLMGQWVDRASCTAATTACQAPATDLAEHIAAEDS